MSEWIRHRALGLRRKLCIEGIASNDEIDAALDDYKVKVELDERLLYGPPELVIDRTLLLRPGLDIEMCRFLCPHGLGHVIMHPGCSQPDLDWVTRNRQEHQADVFAFWFIVGDTEPPEPMTRDWEIAGWATIPVERVRCIRGLLRWRSSVRR